MLLFAPRRDWPRHRILFAATAAAALTAGCAPKIGDKCTVSTDCSVNGDRLCDSTQPSGYCTVFNCEPNACPDDSLCVEFTEPTCTSPAESDRFTRTFCMASCTADGDCRAGYTCLDITHDPERMVVDINPSSRRICTVPPPAPPPMASTMQPAVCNPSDGGSTTSTAGDGAADAGDAAAETSTDASETDAPTADAPAESEVSTDVAAPDGADAGVDATAD
jgi:hypothetical protein